MQRLQNTADDVVWDQFTDLLTWMLYLGGTFASTDLVRDGYVGLLHQKFPGVYISWEGLLSMLQQFIWSKRAFEPAVQRFYDEVARP